MAEAAHPAIRFRDVEKWYGTRDEPVYALAPTDLSVAQAELVVLLGPSGCGKTTMTYLAHFWRDRDRGAEPLA